MSEPDTEKILHQQLEMDLFFTGDFTIKPVQEQISSAAPNRLENPDAVPGLKEIEEQVCRCQRCELANSRTNAVPGEGNPHARIAFVGEAPGADEDAQGRPFVGRAGKLLDKIITALGLNRSDVFIGNILKCRPPGNRDPRPNEIISCLPFLQDQLQLIQPEIIVALGAHAAKTLLETNKPIGQLRGRFHDFYPSAMAQPIKLMPTYHPAYLLRNYSRENRLRVWEDMKKVLEELGLDIPESRNK
jgi:DNA polymerase